MNIDADGEPQAYAPLSRSDLRPRDVLGNACWKSKEQNEALKAKWAEAVKILADLEKQKADLTTVKPADGGQPAKPATPPAVQDLKALDEKIKQAKDVLTKNYFWDEKHASRPTNYGRIFWRWCGVKSLPKSAERSMSWWETVGKQKIPRHPDLDKSDIYEDIDGTFPVKQSQYEPGEGYFVTQMPHAANKSYPEWDQRYFLPNNALLQGPYAALSTGLATVSGVALGDTWFAFRLDSGQAAAFPFSDSGYGLKVGECGYEAFDAVGGVLAQNINQSRNDFLLLYLAFPGGRRRRRS
jgi:hypothetical protein